ncbi:MAG: hypothetical protein Q9174_002270 [Haloplaca sp. 1 TL-2023]
MRFFPILATALAALAAAAPAPENNTPAPHEPFLITKIIHLTDEPHKIERNVELAKEYVHKVAEQEPDTLVFDVFLDKEAAKFIIFAAFKDQHAFEHHFETHYLEELIQILDHEHLRDGKELFVLKQITGFHRDDY